MSDQATPEKMVLEPCPMCGTHAETDGVSHIRCANTYNCDIQTRLGPRAWNRREAARRLSAPAAYERLTAEHLAASAPPAPSADQREELARELWIANRFGFGADNEQQAELRRRLWLDDDWIPEQEKRVDMAIYDSRAHWRKMADFALGYRKLAPAQSVGQSAAQGVDAEELVKWCQDYTFAFTDDAPPRVVFLRTMALVVSKIRRLSALPKGQEHE